MNRELKDLLSEGGQMVSSRRVFLGRFAALGAAGLGISSVVAGCGGGETGETTSESADGVDEATAQCEDYTGLDQQALQIRETLGYVSVSPNPNQVCTNCRFYNLPAQGEICGGCQLFAGPVTPGGYCNSWAAQTV